MPESNRLGNVATTMGHLLQRGTTATVRATRKFGAIRKVDLEMRRLQSQKMDRLLEIGQRVYNLYKANDLNHDELVKLSESIQQLDQAIERKAGEIDAIRLQKPEDT